MIVRIPLRTVSLTNRREHWATRAKRTKTERDAVTVILRPALDRRFWVNPPFLVTLTRIAPRKLDSDNLQSALKGVRDAVAAVLGMDDGDVRLSWTYRQHPDKQRPREYAVEVEIS